MAITLIADSCCDLTPEMVKEWGVRRVPLTVQVGDTAYIDDGTVDIGRMMDHMDSLREPATSACPSPAMYALMMEDVDEVMVVTLSAKLSGSYQSACIARDMMLQKYPQKKITVFDSKSAAAGETRVLMLLHDLIQSHMGYERIAVRAKAMINAMRTVFVVEDLSVFIKSGRIRKLSGMMASALSLCPVLSDNGDGEIQAVKKARGVKRALAAMIETIAELTENRPAQSTVLVLVYALCEKRAQAVKEAVLMKCRAVREVIAVPAGALSAVYANRGGVIAAF